MRYTVKYKLMNGDKLFTPEGLTTFSAATEVTGAELKEMSKNFFTLPTGITINSQVLKFNGVEIADDEVLKPKQTSYKYTLNLLTKEMSDRMEMKRISLDDSVKSQKPKRKQK
jgi:hypothetical protein